VIQDDDELELDQNRGGRKQSQYKSRLERIQIAKMNQSVELQSGNQFSKLQMLRNIRNQKR